MKRSAILATLVAVVLLLVAATAAFGADGIPNPDRPTPGPTIEPPSEQDPTKAVPNISYPIIFTDIVDLMWQQYPVVDANGVVLSWEVFVDPTTGLPVPIAVAEVIDDTYSGAYAGNDGEFYFYYSLDPVTGCALDIKSAIDLATATTGTPDGVVDDSDRIAIAMSSFLTTNAPWWDQPVYMVSTSVASIYDVPQPDGSLLAVTVTVPACDDPNLIWNADYIDVSDIGGANAWQADWFYTGGVRVDGYEVSNFEPIVEEDYVKVDFIDWGNPLENINPIVGQRFPVEVALYEKLASGYDSGLVDDTADLYDPMTTFKMACLEYPGTKVELFGNGTYDYDGSTGDANTFECAFATVLTTKFFAEVWDPAGGITKIPVEPGIGPSGKMNFASSGGGWIPTMPGWHRIWLHTNDPLISFAGAIVNNDEHYIMSTGCKVQDISANKLELTGIVGDSTFIDVLVMKPSGKTK